MYKFCIKHKEFVSNDKILKGKDILSIANLTPVEDYELLLYIDEKTLEPIQLEEEVDLSKPGTEHFIVNAYKEFHIFVDNEKVELKDSFLTVRELMIAIGKNPNEYKLKQIVGPRSIDYKNDIDHLIQLKNGLKFITLCKEPLTVSFNKGNDELERQLKEKGFNTKRYPNGFVGFDYEVPIGRFKGQQLEIALDAPSFPQVPPSGPYIKPHILPFSPKSGSHPFDGIHDWKKPNSDFQYWSRPFKTWNSSSRNVESYISFLNALMDFE
ncbi:MAG: multiubiquitin domain-containing protein [Ignavibacteriales bacterium]|nr:multiubiquitin domain-containing protein [Ignavibacteriales bacterium]